MPSAVRDGPKSDPASITPGRTRLLLPGGHNEIKRRGVEIVSPLTTQWWGDRTFTIMDPSGYQLWFHQKHVGELKPPQGVKLV